MKDFMTQLKKIFSFEGLVGLGLASAGIGYILVGFDIIPDTIPVLGYADDVLMALLLFFLGAMVARMIMGKRSKK